MDCALAKLSSEWSEEAEESETASFGVSEEDSAGLEAGVEWEGILGKKEGGPAIWVRVRAWHGVMEPWRS